MYFSKLLPNYSFKTLRWNSSLYKITLTIDSELTAAWRTQSKAPCHSHINVGWADMNIFPCEDSFSRILTQGVMSTITNLISFFFFKLTVDYRGNLWICSWKKNHLSDNEPTHTESYWRHIYLYIWTLKNKAAHTLSFCSEPAAWITEMWWMFGGLHPHQQSRDHPLRMPAYRMVTSCISIFPPWFTPDKCRVCWERCIWFHWLALQGFTGLTGLFPL